MPSFFASGSHHAPMPRMMRFGARSSSVKKVAASNPILRVQLLITPLPILMRDVTAANAAIGTIASRTRRDSACHTASKPRCSAYCAYAMPSRISCLSCRYIATRDIKFSLMNTGFQYEMILPYQYSHYCSHLFNLPTDFLAYDLCTCDHRLHFCEGRPTCCLTESAIRQDLQLCGFYILEQQAYPLGHICRLFDIVGFDIYHACSYFALSSNLAKQLQFSHLAISKFQDKLVNFRI